MTVRRVPPARVLDALHVERVTESTCSGTAKEKNASADADDAGFTFQKDVAVPVNVASAKRVDSEMTEEGAATEHVSKVKHAQSMSTVNATEPVALGEKATRA